ncbi:MAG TPA: SDR family oxidoreductase [Burkholderiaceae bacterium]|nr:SDR family oxidoreductase [Burkholderiaceae bacterium]
MSGAPPPLLFLTGASSGIGQALARRFGAAGWRLALVARRQDELRRFVSSQSYGEDDAQIYVADVADASSITAAGRACIERQGLPDAVIANAGISVGIDSARVEDLPVLRDTLQTNVFGVAATFQPFIEPMRHRRRGTLVGVASVAGIRGLPGHAAYCASKAGAIAYCESLRGECRPFGVRVVTLVPGYVDTPLTRSNPYRMPFLMSADAFADSAFAAISAGRSYRVIPWQMALVAKVLRALPNRVFDRLFAGRPRKPRRTESAG